MQTGWRVRACMAATAMLAATLTLSPSPVAAAAAAGQTAVSLSGAYAQATIFGATFPDGSTRMFSAVLSRPDVAVATPGIGPVDLSRPWAVLTETMLNDPATGYADNGRTLCSTATNPSASEMEFGGAVASVDVTCDDGAGYAFYQVQWSVAPQWALVTNPVTSLWMGDEVTTWSADGVTGTVDLWPSTTQVTGAIVCGYRPGAGGHPDCFGQGGLNGLVVPSSNLMLAEYSPSAS